MVGRSTVKSYRRGPSRKDKHGFKSAICKKGCGTMVKGFVWSRDLLSREPDVSPFWEHSCEASNGSRIPFTADSLLFTVPAETRSPAIPVMDGREEGCGKFPPTLFNSCFLRYFRLPSAQLRRSLRTLRLLGYMFFHANAIGGNHDADVARFHEPREDSREDSGRHPSSERSEEAGAICSRCSNRAAAPARGV